MDKQKVVGKRIVVELDFPDWVRESAVPKFGREIEREIGKVDCVSSATLEDVKEAVCEHCGFAWSPGRDGSNGCCPKEIHEHLEAIKRFVADYPEEFQ